MTSNLTNESSKAKKVPPSYYKKDGKVYFQTHLLADADPQTFQAIDNWHARDKDHIFKYLSILPGADPDTFELLLAPLGQLRNRFSKDQSKVYFELNPILNADPKTFEVLDEYYGKDNTGIYFHCEQISTHDSKLVDTETFIALGGCFAKDKNHVYHAGKILKNATPKYFKVFYPDYWATYAKDNIRVFTESGQPLPDVNAKNFDQLDSVPYGMDDRNVYRHAIKIVGADPESFSLLNEDYAMDDNHVYYQGKKIDGAIPKNFSLISSPTIDYYSKDKNSIFKRNKRFPINGSIDDFEILDHGYTKDNSSIYFNGEIVNNADLASFSANNKDGLIRDKHGLYFDGKLRSDIDPETFSWITYELSADKNAVYFMLEKIDNLDPNSIEKINDCYIKDRNNVYYLNERFYEFEKVIDADPKSFFPLNPPWARDKNSIYYYSEKLPKSNPDSFSPIKGAFAKDDQHVYYANTLLKDVDIESFKCIDYWFAKDKYHVYHYDELIEGSESSSFVFLDNGYAKDSGQVYYDGTIVQDAKPEHFEIISDFYAKDGTSIFSASKKINIDYDTARFLNGRYLSDKNQIFHIRNKILNADLASFIIISEERNLSKDKHHVYFREEIVNNADPESFYLINDSQCRDKNFNYRMRQGEWQSYPLD